MADNDSLKVTPAEYKKAQVAALLQERTGYERRLLGAQEAEDEGLEEKMSRRIDEVNAQLRAYGEKASSPAKRSEKRPAVSARAETR